MIEAVIFDLDSTLVDDGPNWRRSVSETLDGVCVLHDEVDRDQLKETYYAVAGAVWEEIRGAPAAPWGNMDDEAIVRRVWDETLRQVGIVDADPLEQAVAGYLRLRSLGAPAFDDARDCLDRLFPSYKLGIVTNGTAAIQRPKIESSGLAPYFQVVTTTDVGSGKPQPEIFMHALETLGTTPKSSVYVGDSLSWDVAGANRTGMISVWLNRQSAQRKPGDPTPHAEIRSLAELPELVASMDR